MCGGEPGAKPQWRSVSPAQVLKVLEPFKSMQTTTKRAQRGAQGNSAVEQRLSHLSTENTKILERGDEHLSAEGYPGGSYSGDGGLTMQETEHLVQGRAKDEAEVEQRLTRRAVSTKGANTVQQD